MVGEVMAIHKPHGLWRRKRRCVYCPCGARLYQGKAPRTKAEQRDIADALDAIAAAAARRMGQ